ncbi:MAG: DoxX family protein [Rhizobium sp.]
MEPSGAVSSQTVSELRHALIWLMEVSATLLFALSGLLKLSKPIAYLGNLGVGSADILPEWAVRITGLLELISSGALLVPAMLGVLVAIAPVAAAALLLLQTFAVIIAALHSGAGHALALNIVLLGCLAVVARHRCKAMH